MDTRRSGLSATAALFLLAVACQARPLDPGGHPTTGDPTTPTTGDDLPAALAVLAGPDTRLVVGTNAGAVTKARSGGTSIFEQDPETLVEAAAAVGMSVCSVEMQTLVTPSTATDQAALSIDAAAAACDRDDLGDMLARLSGLKTASTVVVIAANTAITVRSTNGGINYFYDADILRLLHAARKVYVPVCIVAPDSLALPSYPQGQTPGVSVDEALARCGR